MHHDGNERTVKEAYELNRLLIDLMEIPPDIKLQSLEIISQSLGKVIPSVDIGTGFLKFCGKWELHKISEHAADFMPMLKSKYDHG